MDSYELFRGFVRGLFREYQRNCSPTWEVRRRIPTMPCNNIAWILPCFHRRSVSDSTYLICVNSSPCLFCLDAGDFLCSPTFFHSLFVLLKSPCVLCFWQCSGFALWCSEFALGLLCSGLCCSVLHSLLCSCSPIALYTV